MLNVQKKRINKPATNMHCAKCDALTDVSNKGKEIKKNRGYNFTHLRRLVLPRAPGKLMVPSPVIACW
jgi:hypothetical protein